MSESLITPKPSICILIVCSGNSFRSAIAEAMLKFYCGPDSNLIIRSAGTKADPDEKVWGVVADRIRQEGPEIKDHVPTRLTKEILDQADLIVAMTPAHQQSIRDNFAIEAKLFLEIVEGRSEGIPDVTELLADVPLELHNREEMERMAVKIADSLIGMIPRFLKEYPRFLQSELSKNREIDPNTRPNIQLSP